MRSEAAESSRETVRIKGGQSKEMGSRESQSEGVEERREASAREGCKGGVLVERRFCRTTSRWPRAMNSDWGGFRRSSLVVRPRIVMYPRRIALSRVELDGEPRERETYVAKAASLRLKIGGVVGLMEKTEMSGVKVGEGGGGWGGSGVGMWSRHTFSLACLEPTRTGVGSPGAKIESEVGVRRQEPEA